MKALILLAHGSYREESNIEVQSLAQGLRGKLLSKFDYIEGAFLEFAQPDLLGIIEKINPQKDDRVIILPYFLNSGNHICRDIPKLIQQAETHFQTSYFQLLPHIGSNKQMTEFLLAHINLNI